MMVRIWSSVALSMVAGVALGLLLASPVIGYQLWAFLSPALYKHEKRVIIPVLAGGVGLFLAGALLPAFAAFQVPAHDGYVTDSANVLSDETEAAMSQTSGTSSAYRAGTSRVPWWTAMPAC